jgi:uncharacterized membrane protein YbhN (UPF0104 family)/tRNA A-37 threonylcarbamoyl transferase component Bud32
MRGDHGTGATGFRIFSSPVDEPRARRATDLLLGLGALGGLVVLGWLHRPPTSFERALIDLLAAVPDVLDEAWQLLYDLPVLWAAGLVVLALVRRRPALARDQVLAVGVALVVGLVAGHVVEPSWPGIWSALRVSEPPPHFPALRVALAGAVAVTASPHLSHPVRRVGRWVVGLGAVAATVLGAATPTAAGAGLLVALLAGAVVHQLFGSCGGRPGLGDVRDALDDLGVPMASLGAADRQRAGAFLVRGRSTDGRDLEVKVYGRDAYDAQLVNRLWRTVWYRDQGPVPSASRLQLAEHEAFLTLLARQAGVPTQEVVTAGVTAEDDALLVLQLRGEPLADLAAADGTDAPDGAVTDAVLHGLWRAVRLLHASAIVHGQIEPRHVWVDGGAVTLVDMSAASVAPSADQRRTDEAQALVTSVLVAGTDRGLAVAREVLGAAGLGAVLPYLQTPAMPRTMRPQIRQARLDLDDLRTRAGELAGAPPVELQRLRRVTWGSLLQTGMLLLAFAALLSGFAGLDLGDLSSELRGANWAWIGLSALLVQVPRLAQAVSTLGASPRPLPLGPVYALQLAISYVNLAIPSAAARIAVNVRFFQRQGVPAGSAVAVGAVDGFSGFVVQILLLGSMLLFSSASLDLDLDPSTAGRLGRLLALLVVVVAVLALAVLAVRPWRRALVAKATELVTDAWVVLRGLRSGRRLALLFGGNLAAEVLFAASLGGFARAFGYPLGLGDLLVINVSVALLAGVMPVPGGIGVTEGALTFGLAAAGLPESTAFAVAITYRLAAFYLPPIWGWFAFRWLQTNRYL